MNATPTTHLNANADTRPDDANADARSNNAVASHPANPMARKTIISGLSVYTQMSSVAGAPVVYLLGNVTDHSPVQVPAGVSLVHIGVDLWEENFSPWCAPRVFAKGPNFGNGAQKTLDVLNNRVIPWAESDLTEPPAYRVLVGYSLAGLFSLWAGVTQAGVSPQVARGYQHDIPAASQLSTTAATFQRIGAVSGSFWFPGLLDFLDRQLGEGAVSLTHAYLSLGNREARTPNPQIMHVQENAELLAGKLRDAGIISTFELNRGNHFQNVDRRIQKALNWLVTQD